MHQLPRRRYSVVVFAAAVLTAAAVTSPLLEWITGSLHLPVPLDKSKRALGGDLHNVTASMVGDATLDKPTESSRFEEQDAFISSGTTNFSGVLARPFDSWPHDTPLPCFPAERNWSTVLVQHAPTNSGFLYLKPFKTGSSTCSGINLRISRHVASRTFDTLADPAKNETYSFCQARFSHGPQPYPAASLFAERDAERSFLWTAIREPTRRAISEFFHFRVSRKKRDPTDENLREFLIDGERHKRQDYYIRSLHIQKRFNRTLHDPIQASNEILDEYNFIGITERMDESAVVLVMLLQLPLAGALYLSAKKRGGFDAGGGLNNQCTYIVPSFVTPGMQETLDSQEWQNQVKYDRALYLAANRSLDLTIDRLGRAEFEKNLVRFRRAREVVQQRCLPVAAFPCNKQGTMVPPNETDCFWKDSGCGTTCLDSVATELALW